MISLASSINSAISKVSFQVMRCPSAASPRKNTRKFRRCGSSRLWTLGMSKISWPTVIKTCTFFRTCLRGCRNGSSTWTRVLLAHWMSMWGRRINRNCAYCSREVYRKWPKWHKRFTHSTNCLPAVLFKWWRLMPNGNANSQKANNSSKRPPRT